MTGTDDMSAATCCARVTAPSIAGSAHPRGATTRVTRWMPIAVPAGGRRRVGSIARATLDDDRSDGRPGTHRGGIHTSLGFAVAVAAAAALTALAPPIAIAESGEFYVEDIPLGLASSDARAAPNLRSLTKGANGKEIEKCATKCIATCTRGGSGAPGLGPLSVRKAPVVFKEGFRSRQYCLSECTEICSITVKDSKK